MAQWRIQGEGPGGPDLPIRPNAYNFEAEILTSTGWYCAWHFPTKLNSRDIQKCNYFWIYMLFAGWEARMVKNCDRGLENTARGRRPRAAFSRPRSQFFTIRTDP